MGLQKLSRGFIPTLRSVGTWVAYWTRVVASVLGVCLQTSTPQV